MNFTEYLYKGMTPDTYYFSLLDGIDNVDKQDKKSVIAYLNKHPKLEKRKGEKGYFLKGYDFIQNAAIKLGTTACYFANTYWCLNLKNFTDGYRTRMFYSYLYPEIIDALIDRMCKNADAIKEIAQYPNKYKEKIKLDKLQKDF